MDVLSAEQAHRANLYYEFIGYSVSSNVTGAVTANVTIAGSVSAAVQVMSTSLGGSYSFRQCSD